MEENRKEILNDGIDKIVKEDEDKIFDFVAFKASDAKNLSLKTGKTLKRIYKLIKEVAAENCSRVTYNFNDVLADVIIEIASSLRNSGYNVEADFRTIDDEDNRYTLNNVCLAEKDQIFDYVDLKISW